MKEKIVALLERHHGSLGTEAAAIAAHIATIDALTSTQREDLVRQVHTLKGSSGSLGFATVFTAAETLEHCLRQTSDAPVDQITREKINTLDATLTEVISAVRVEDSSLLAKFA